MHGVITGVNQFGQLAISSADSFLIVFNVNTSAAIASHMKHRIKEMQYPFPQSIPCHTHIFPITVKMGFCVKFSILN